MFCPRPDRELGREAKNGAPDDARHEAGAARPAPILARHALRRRARRRQGPARREFAGSTRRARRPALRFARQVATIHTRAHRRGECVRRRDALRIGVVAAAAPPRAAAAARARPPPPLLWTPGAAGYNLRADRRRAARSRCTCAGASRRRGGADGAARHERRAGAPRPPYAGGARYLGAVRGVSSLVHSPGGGAVAYSVDFSGDEQYQLVVLRTPDEGEGSAAASARASAQETAAAIDAPLAWGRDDGELFYATLDATGRPHRLHRHAVGRPAAEQPPPIFEERDARFRLSFRRAADGSRLLLSLESRDASEVWALPVDAEEATSAAAAAAAGGGAARRQEEKGRRQGARRRSAAALAARGRRRRRTFRLGGACRVGDGIRRRRVALPRAARGRAAVPRGVRRRRLLSDRKPRRRRRGGAGGRAALARRGGGGGGRGPRRVAARGRRRRFCGGAHAAGAPGV